MAHVQRGHGEDSKEALALELIPFKFTQGSGKTIEVLIDMHKVLVDVFDDANRAWLARGRLEVVLAIDFLSELLQARSMADVAGACRQCAIQRLDMWAEETRRLAESGKKIVRASAHLISNGSAHRHGGVAFGRAVDSTLGD